MKRRRRRGDRFSDESVDPMNYVSNLSDAMLVLAVGMMLALIVHWNVDISTGGRSSEITMSGICDLSKSSASASLAADITL